MTFTAAELEKMIRDYVDYWAARAEGSSDAASDLLAEAANKLEKNKLEIAKQLLEVLKTIKV